MKYWEIIANNIISAGFNVGWVSAVDSCGRTIWIADAHRGDGKRFVVQAEEELTAFVELSGTRIGDSRFPAGARRWRAMTDATVP